MLVWHTIEDFEGLEGHKYCREEPWPETWCYDRFGREPKLGDYFVYTTVDEKGNYHPHIGLIYLESSITVSIDPITGKPWKLHVLHYAKVRSSSIPRKGEKLIRTLKNGLSVFSPFYELSQARSDYGIFLLRSEIDTKVFPHLS